MNQAVLDFDAPPTPDAKHSVQSANLVKSARPAPRPCHNAECAGTALPGKEMCGACAERFGGYLRGKILGWGR